MNNITPNTNSQWFRALYKLAQHKRLRKDNILRQIIENRILQDFTMPHLEYNDNGHLIPPVGLTMVELYPNKNESTIFKWSDAIGNKIKKDVVVFKHGKVKELLH